jgi:prepilin-type N-terminal cleavage/methylation domain-containing protein/prepilin-type processing-associated H-X9-DG protein
MNPTRPFTFKKTRNDGFTLIELLVVIVTVAILALLLLPAIAGTKPNSQAFQCLENLRQLTLGWQMYAEDNTGKLAPNGDQVTQATTPTDPSYLSGGANFQWCPGNMNPFSPYATNFVQAGCIYPYVKTMNVYKCPADQSGTKFGPFFYPHVRSYSMNCYLSPILGPPSDAWPSVGTKNFFKDTDMIRPGPAMTYVFIDENQFSINDGFFVSDPTQGNYWQDVPAARHGNAGGLSFADGHSEIKRWTDKNVLNPPRFVGFTGDPSSGDSAWLHQRATSVN